MEPWWGWITRRDRLSTLHLFLESKKDTNKIPSWDTRPMITIFRIMAECKAKTGHCSVYESNFALDESNPRRKLNTIISLSHFK